MYRCKTEVKIAEIMFKKHVFFKHVKQFGNKLCVHQLLVGIHRKMK